MFFFEAAHVTQHSFLERLEFFGFLKKIFWWLFGFLLFMPFEVFVNGLYFSYFQILALFFLSGKISRKRFFLYTIYIFLVLFSIEFGHDVALSSIVNPIITALVLTLGSIKKNNYILIKKGVYFSAFLNALLLVGLCFYSGFSSLTVLLTSRIWALPYIPYFGNGLAMMFSLAMIIAAKEYKVKLVIIFFIGGLLTTSRIPLLSMAIILFFYSMHLFSLKTFLKVLAVLFLASVFILPRLEGFVFSGINGIGPRLAEASDRETVYSLAINRIEKQPLLGFGSEKLPYFEHAHNSYLQVAYKSGLLSLIVWLGLIYLCFFRRMSILKNLPFFFVFVVVSMTQIGLQNPNLLLIILLYSLLYSSD